MAREDGFLSRWSRLKQEAARPAAPQPAPAELEAARAETAVREAEAARAAAERVVAEERERDALLAKLPKLEDLRADSDFSQFMHPLVPPPLRSAALARLWSLDAAISSYEDPARDYAWNWNVPGGVPGGGPAPTAEEVQSTLRDIFKRFDSEERVGDPTPPPAVAQAGDPAAPAAQPEAADPAPQQRSADVVAPAPASKASPAETPRAQPVASERVPAAAADAAASDAGAAAPSAVPRRRHGGAMPA